MDIDNILGEVCRYILANDERYARRFNFAASERWICTEICHIVNFDLGLNPLEETEDKQYSLYDEDEKRDLSLYQGYNERAKLIKHIEVKVVYPMDGHKSKWFKPLLSTMQTSLNKLYDTEGWVFLVWTSGVRKRDKYRTPESFFDSIKKYIKSERTKELLGNVFLPDLHFLSVAETNFTWCGAPKRVVVKAMRVNMIKPSSDATPAVAV